MCFKKNSLFSSSFFRRTVCIFRSRVCIFVVVQFVFFRSTVCVLRSTFYLVVQFFGRTVCILRSVVWNFLGVQIVFLEVQFEFFKSTVCISRSSEWGGCPFDVYNNTNSYEDCFFYMDVKDFLQYFDGFTIGSLIPDFAFVGTNKMGKQTGLKYSFIKTLFAVWKLIDNPFPFFSL